MEFIGEIIIQFFGEILLAFLALLGGWSIDAGLKLLSLRVPWGFSYDKNSLFAMMAFVGLFMAPISLYNNWSIIATSLFVGLYLFATILCFICYVRVDSSEISTKNDILDEDLVKQKRK